MSLTKYLHQVKPRDESYVNHVDRIQGLFTISEGQAGLDYETKVFGVMMDYQKTRPGFFGLGVGDKPVETKGEVPSRSVVIPGTYTKNFKAGDFQVPCALIIGKRKESTNKKTSLNDALRDYNVSA